MAALVFSLAPDEAASVSLMHAMTWLGHDAAVDELLWAAVAQAELAVLWRREVHPLAACGPETRSHASASTTIN
mgnify:CR=1 FL=1